MRLTDGKADFGWISIGLHWAGAGLVLTLLFVGNSIRTPQGAAQGQMLWLHTTIAGGFYLLLWARVIWRFRVGHPGPLPRQKPFTYGLGKAFHYLLLAALGAMLVSGPVMAWTGDLPLRIGGLTLGNPLGVRPSAFAILRAIHIAGATVLGWGTLVHVLAVIKHTVIDADGAFDKIMVPLERSQPSAANAPASRGD